jgi:galactokinase
MLLDSGFAAAGWDGVMASDIPGGASLSSSAALEVASGLAYTVAAGASIEPQQLAKVGQRVENEVLGLPSGILDQLASAAAVDGAASLIDCRDLSTQAVPLPDGVDIVIMDTGTRRELVDSEYAARQADCQAAAKALGVAALRDATLDQLAALTDDILVRRARHVIAENQRTLDAAQAMRDGDVTELGLLMNASHASLRDDYEVSGPALDRIVEVAQHAPGCLGARMTGGGFAGAAVALVESADTASFIATVLDQFTAPPQQPSTAPVRLYPVRPGPGATIVTAP